VSTSNSTSGSDRTAGDSTTTDGLAVRDFFMAAPLLRGASVWSPLVYHEQ
jgi:hypothetical protein